MSSRGSARSGKTMETVIFLRFIKVDKPFTIQTLRNDWNIWDIKNERKKYFNYLGYLFGKLFVCFSWSKIEIALFILKSSLLVAHQFSNRARFQFQLTRQKDNLLVLHGNLRFKLHSTAFRFLKVHLYIYTMLSKFRDFGITKHLCFEVDR